MGSTAFTRRFALFKQTMICDNRDPSLLSMKSLTVLAFAIGIIDLHTSHGSAKGMYALEMIFCINQILLPIAAVALFLPVIMEERKKQTMGLLLMTGLDAFGYLVGKCGSRLVQLLMLVSLQIPFAILGIAMGGIALEMVLEVYLFLFAYTFFICSICIFCSLYFNSFFSGLLVAGLIFTCILCLCFLLTDSLYHNSLDYLISESFEAIYNVGFSGTTQTWRQQQSHIIYYIVIFSLAGFALLILTLTSFASRSMFLPTIDLDSKTTEIVEKVVPRRYLKKERFSTENPIFTKDYYYILHGRFLTILQTLIIIGIFASGYIFSNSYLPLLSALQAGITVSYLILFITAWYAGNRIWYEEIEAMTFNSLKLTPKEMSTLSFQKNKAVLRCLLPSIISFIIFWMALINLADITNDSEGEIHLLASFLLISVIPLVFSVSLWLSLYIKKMRFLISGGVCGFIFCADFMAIEQAHRGEPEFMTIFAVAQLIIAMLFMVISSKRISEKYLD